MKYILLLSSSLIILATACQSYQSPQLRKVDRYQISDAYDATASEEIAALIAPYKSELEAQSMEEVIAYFEQPFPKQHPESLLGNWLADLLAEEANRICREPVDFAVQNYGGIRIPELPAGPVTVGKVFELMPFDNTLVVLDMEHELLTTFCQQMAADGGWPQSAALRYVIENGRAVDIHIQGIPLQENKIYRVALPDYIANGGGDCDFLIELAQEKTQHLIRDLIINHLRSKNSNVDNPIDYELDGRLSVRE